jgi:3-oxoacyl-[acyl-carrier protein] reductase
MSDQHEKHSIVVTGGSRGIGKAVCLALAGPSQRIYFNYFSPVDPEGEAAAAAETVRAVEKLGGEATGVSVDVASPEELTAFFNRVVKETGRIDVLINNAGITKDGMLLRMKESDWDAVLNINLKAAFRCMQLAGKVMMKQRYGRIINMASIVGVIGNAGQANYVASKAGLIGLTKSAAKELAPRGITVNAIAPGFIETDMTAGLPENVKETMLAQIPLGRAGKPEDVAAAVVFLVSESAAYITGQVIHVSGGMFM